MICNCKEKSMKGVVRIIPIIILLSLTSCQSKDYHNTILTSFYPVYEFTSRIVGDLYEVETITPPGTEPHDFELSPKKVAALEDCKALMINGVHIENWFDSVSKNVKNKTCVLSDNINIRITDGQEDPHIWLNPINAIAEMNNITNFMCELDAEHKNDYLNNLASATAEFTNLDNQLMEIANSLSQKNILVAHAAYGYMCDRYGLNQIAVNGVEPDQEPTAQAIESIIKAVEDYGITTIFTEELISSRASELISKECGVKAEVLSPLEEAEDDEDYISVMLDNFKKIQEASK